jgi:hypothetical protein
MNAAARAPAATPPPASARRRRRGVFLIPLAAGLLLAVGAVAAVAALVRDDGVLLAPAGPRGQAALTGPAPLTTPAPGMPGAAPATQTTATTAPRPTQAAQVLVSPTTAPATPVPATPTVVPTATPSLLMRVNSAQADLRRGRIVATMGYESDTQSQSELVFDFGLDEAGPRLRLTSTYNSSAGKQTTQRIVIGDQSWDRSRDGRWTVGPTRESVWHQVHSYLPKVDHLTDVSVSSAPDNAILHYVDPSYGTEVTLRVDPVTGALRDMRRKVLATGSVLVVTYEWNSPVEPIEPPAV